MKLVKCKDSFLTQIKKLTEESTKKSLIADTEKLTRMVKQLCV